MNKCNIFPIGAFNGCDFDTDILVIDRINQLNEEIIKSILVKCEEDGIVFVEDFEKEVPKFIGIVPEVAELNALNVGIMNSLYDKYKQKVGGRNVEGFVISYNDNIVKYLRMKGGKLIDHKE